MAAAREPSAGAQNALHSFITHEATAGLVLVLAAALAMVAANVPGLARAYGDFLALPVSVGVGALGIEKPLLLWINDGLMAVFFFLVGLELKREVLEGQLSSAAQIALPAVAAVGGMAVPALVYVSVVLGADDPALLDGWAIPAATDIAFALGMLALLGARVPVALKVLLLTLATLDDLGAIVVIALFYTENLSATSLGLGAAMLALLFGMNRAGVTRVAPYVLVGVALWVFVLRSGVHATLAGVMLALAIPLRKADGTPIIERLEHGLHPYVTWFILPLFAFANAGVSLDGMTAAALLAPLPAAIMAGLTLGKPVGITGAALIAVKTGLARLPAGLTMRHVLGVGCLAGIGFTMSLFIGMLAFEGDDHGASVRLGVITGSLISAGAGYLLLRYWAPAAAVGPTPAAGS